MQQATQQTTQPASSQEITSAQTASSPPTGQPISNEVVLVASTPVTVGATPSDGMGTLVMFAILTGSVALLIFFFRNRNTSRVPSSLEAGMPKSANANSKINTTQLRCAKPRSSTNSPSANSKCGKPSSAKLATVQFPASR